MKLFDGKDQIPIFAPYDVAVVNGKLFEFLFFEVLVVLGVRMAMDKFSDVDTLNGVVVESHLHRQVASGRASVIISRAMF